MLAIQPRGGGGAVRPALLCFFPLLKISLSNPYLKILEFSQLFVPDAPRKKKKRNLVLPPHRALCNRSVKSPIYQRVQMEETYIYK